MTPAADVVGHMAELAASRAGALAGRSVGLLGRGLPPELPAALGLDPAVLSFAADGAALQAGGAFARPDSCPFCRTVLGGLTRAGRPGFVIAGTACDQERRMLEALGRWSGLRVLAFSVPRTTGDNALRRYQEQVAAIMRQLEIEFGVRLQPGALRAAVADYRQLRARLAEWRPVLGFAEFTRLVADGFFMGPARALAALNSVGAGFKPAPATLAAPPAGLRIVLAGSCLLRNDADALEAALRPAGAEIVDDVMALPSGLLEVEAPADDDRPAAVAAAWFRRPDIGCRPNDAWHAKLKRKVQAARADAVIFRVLKFCDANAAEQLRVREALAPVPVLFLDEEPGDGAAARRRTRLEALLETVLCRKA
jgi:benzoyl-CoA reductase/2-hydroxyglutaryl-CoA dehydratase subunit BcrC/BadD/HgdB